MIIFSCIWDDMGCTVLNTLQSVNMWNSNICNNKGPKMEPCGTPYLKVNLSDNWLEKDTANNRPSKYDWNQLRTVSDKKKSVVIGLSTLSDQLYQKQTSSQALP